MRIRRFLLRSILAFIVGILILGTVFWLRLSADEPEVVLPTVFPTAAIVAATPTAVATTVEIAYKLTSVEPDGATFTPIPTVTNTPPPGATSTPTPSPTPSPTLTPTSLPQPEVDGITVFLPTEPTLVPEATPVDQIEMPSGITNILLIGNDSPHEDETDNTVRTDTLIIVSVNREEQTASMLSIPRDLYLYTPGWKNARINSAFAHGNRVQYPGGGVQLLKDTILYNFGIPIHYYARIDFGGFEDIVDAVGGIEIINSCELTDWRLKEPGLNIYVEENYMMHTLEPGVHQMDGFMALWYARSRRTTSDFDRGRRQQQILNAILNKGIDLNLVPQLPTMWDAFQETVETDMDIGKALQLAAIATTVRNNGIQHLYLTQGEIIGHTVPDTGANVQLLVPEEARKTFQRLYQPPSINRGRSPITVGIVNGSGDPDMAYLAADSLQWFGFVPVIVEAESQLNAQTSLVYHRDSFKGSYDWLIKWVFRQSSIDLQSNASAAYDYEVTLGTDYNPCRNPLYAPRARLDAES